MSRKKQVKSVSLVLLYMFSIMIGLVSLPTAMAVNETTQGTVTGVETWTGTMNLQGDVEVAEGAKLVINAGTTINIPYGKFIDVKGAICVGDTSCGASAGSASSQARFMWALPTDYNKVGRCYINGSNQFTNGDAACGSGLIIRNTIDQSITSLNYAHFENAYGYPIYVSTLQAVQYGALVFDGSSTTARGLSFKDINTSNVLAIDFASPTLTDSTFELGIDGRGYDAAAVRAYSAGAGILSTFEVKNSVFTGADADCGQQGGGRAVIFIEDSYIDMDNLDVKQNSYGILMKSSSGSLTNSIIDVKCNAVDTNSLKTTGNIQHTLEVIDNTITTAEGAGLTAYDGAKVYAEGNTISGATEGSGVGIRSSNVELHRNTIGPVGGWNGLWIYGTSDVVAENNTIQDTGKEPVLIGEYHYQDQGWQVPAPTAARLYLANNQISNNSGTCNSQMYGGDFACPAVHVFRSSATIIGNTISQNVGDIIRAKGSLVNVQDNTADSQLGYAGNISLHDDNYGNKYGSVAYFSGNSWTGVSQVYNITESRVTVQSEQIPSPGGGELYPVNIRWLGAECPFVQDECLQLPGTVALPPAQMPLALELVENATVFSFADLQNFDSSMIHVQNQNTAWGSQVREGELVRYQVKAKNSNVAGATVVIKDATGLPLYELTTDAFGFTQQVSLPSDFLLDRNWNHIVGDKNAAIPGSNDGTGQPIVVDEDSCADGIDNDGDTLTDDADPDCATGREKPFYSVEAFKFGSGTKDFSYVLSGPIDDVINLNNLRPGVSVNEPDGYSFATTVRITGQAWDGVKWPYANDNTAIQSQFGMVERVEIQPPGSTDWYIASDTSGASDITMANHPYKDWLFEWDMSAHPEGEGDVTFRIRSYDGLDYSPVEVRQYKLNLVSPTILVDVPTSGSTHNNGKVLFQGTASDPYQGTYGSDVKQIWFHISGPGGMEQQFFQGGSTSWSYEWLVGDLPSGDYTVTVWAADSDFCIDDNTGCQVEVRTITINNENIPPNLQLSWIGSADQMTGGIDGDTVRASEDTKIIGVARDVGGFVTRVEIEITDLANGLVLNDGPLPVTTFNADGSWVANWDTSDLIHDRVYSVSVKAYDGDDYSETIVWRMTINNPLDAENIDPVFNETGWVGTWTIFCDEQSDSFDRCGNGVSFYLTEFFSDPDGTGEPANDLEFFIYDDPANSQDDYFFDYISITPTGELTFDPMSSYLWQSTPSVSDWSLEGVVIYAQDDQESKAYSLKVNFLVRGVTFSVERVDDGAITADNPATFRGEGLPGSTVSIRFAQGNARVNSTTVLSDGTWSMDLTASQLGIEGKSAVIFEMDGQEFAFAGQGDAAEFAITVASSDDGSSGIIGIVLIVLAVLVLLGAGAYFFIEFEEVPDEDDLTSDDSVEEEDPYAWAKAKQAPAIPAQAAVPEAQAAAPQQEAAPAASQHPGWLWDATTNQWVPDPNYQPPQQ
ncbi:MAG: right-handed parallel beta-helix repeat-containing protein [Poseidonia sp.]